MTEDEQQAGTGGGKRGGRRPGAGRPAQVGAGENVTFKLGLADLVAARELAAAAKQSLVDYLRSTVRTRAIRHLDRLGDSTIAVVCADLERFFEQRAGQPLPAKDAPIVVLAVSDEEVPLLSRLLRATGAKAQIERPRRFSGVAESQVALPIMKETLPLLYLMLRRALETNRRVGLHYAGDDYGALLARSTRGDSHDIVVRVLETMRGGGSPLAEVLSAPPQS